MLISIQIEACSIKDLYHLREQVLIHETYILYRRMGSKSFHLTKESVITSDRIYSAFPLNYHKMDVFYGGPLYWRGRLCTNPPQTESLIITGHSDYPIVDALIKMYPRTIWWGTNNQTTQAHSLPLGITNDTNESSLHPVYGNIDIMLNIVETPRILRNVVYMNFSINTYPSERKRVWDMFRDKDWVTIGTHVPTLEGRCDFLTNIRNHTFTLCPRGNGIDTHRLWETLYMGGIPIVRRDIVHRDWTDLPIVFVDDWDEVTYDFLQKEEKRIQSSSWTWEKLHVDYWINKIHENRK